MIKFGNDVIKFNGSWITNSDPYNPLGLPPYTIRLKCNPWVTPTFNKGTSVLVDAEQGIWDLTYVNNDWTRLLIGNLYIYDVLGANTIGVTSMNNMFRECYNLNSVQVFNTSNVTDMSEMFYYDSALTSAPLFDTSNVTSMYQMFHSCGALVTVPLFDTSKVTDMNYMFSDCLNVESGALALYQQASTQINPPTGHTGTFKNCGSNTQTGAAELAQIPTSWGGTMQ